MTIDHYNALGSSILNLYAYLAKVLSCCILDTNLKWHLVKLLHDILFASGMVQFLGRRSSFHSLFLNHL